MVEPTLSLAWVYPMRVPKEVPMNWEKLAEGSEVLRVWKELPPKAKEPEIAILRLTEKKHKELLASPKEFVNKPQVFDKPVNSLFVQPGGAGDATWFVMIIHTIESNARAVTAAG
jgi:hypothetical protein